MKMMMLRREVSRRKGRGEDCEDSLFISLPISSPRSSRKQQVQLIDDDFTGPKKINESADPSPQRGVLDLRATRKCMRIMTSFATRLLLGALLGSQKGDRRLDSRETEADSWRDQQTR